MFIDRPINHHRHIVCKIENISSKNQYHCFLIADSKDFINHGFDWTIKMSAFPVFRGLIDYNHPNMVKFNSSSYWSECGKFKRGKFEY